MKSEDILSLLNALRMQTEDVNFEGNWYTISCFLLLLFIKNP